MQAASLVKPCSVCGRPTSMWCSRCENKWYCCPEHLNGDWARHRKECVPAPCSSPTAQGATPTTTDSQVIAVSAVLFAPEEERPKLITVNCRVGNKATHGLCPVPDVEKYFDDRQSEGIVLTQGLNGEPLRFPLHLWYSSTSLQRGSPVNRAIYNITSGAANRHWCGPVVVLKYNGTRRQGYTDAGSNDLPALSAYFLAYK